MKTQEIFCEVTIPVSLERIRDILVGAFEGGSNYWMRIVGFDLPAGVTKADFKEGGKHAVLDEFDNRVWHMAYVVPFTPDCGVILDDAEEETTHTLTLEKIKEGIRVMAKKYPWHFMNIINENDDAETSDVFLQCCLFREAIYG